MIEVQYSATFIKMVRRLEANLRDDVYSRVEDLKDPQSHLRLKIHKLHGRMQGLYGFSVNHNIRIVFEKVTARTYLLHIVGGHEIYE
jgi:mRNA-degrading endonuclease YafQ of YafQ-DinJ toxin-antitoxin module